MSVGKEVGDQALHVGISIVGLAPTVILDPLLAFTWAGFWFAATREDAQHRPEEGWRWPLEGSGGRWLDMACGTLGGLATGALARLASGT